MWQRHDMSHFRACFDICMRQRSMTWWSCHEGWCRHKAQSQKHTLHWCAETDLGSSVIHILDPIWYVSWIWSYLGFNVMHILDLIWYVSWNPSDTHLGSDLIYHILDPIWCISWIQSSISYHILDPIRDTSHSSLSYSTISTHTHTHSRRGLSMIIRCTSAISSSSAGKLKSVEEPWGEYPLSYQQIFQTHNSFQCYLFRGIASWSDCHHTLTWPIPSFIYIGLQCQLIRSSLMLLL